MNARLPSNVFVGGRGRLYIAPASGRGCRREVRFLSSSKYDIRTTKYKLHTPRCFFLDSSFVWIYSSFGENKKIEVLWQNEKL